MHVSRWSDDLQDDEYPDYDAADDEMNEVVACPACGADVYEDAVACPNCGTYITAAAHPFAGRPWWWLMLGLLGVVSLVWALVGI